MSVALIVQHDELFGPGRILTVFRDFGIPTRVVRADQDEPVPVDLDEVRLWVSLGGRMHLSTAEGLGWLAAEVESVQRLVDADRPVLGLGLGAQILAQAAGAAVKPNVIPPKQEGAEPTPAPHYGWGGIKLPFPGGTEPVVLGLMDGAPMFWWQRDSFELPKLAPPPGYDPNKPGPPPPTGNALLTSSAWCRNAGFRFKTKLFGFQWHPELTRRQIDLILDNDGNTLTRAHGEAALAQARADTDKNYERYERLGNRVLTNLVQFLKAYNTAL